MAGTGSTDPRVALGRVDGQTIGKIADNRRVLPTQDWVAQIDPANLSRLRASRLLAVTHFYRGLSRLRADFDAGTLVPPPFRSLPTAIIGAVKLPNGSFARRIAVTVAPIQIPGRPIPYRLSSLAITDPNGNFTLRDFGDVELPDTVAITLIFRGANGSETRSYSLDQLGGGILGFITLQLDLTPLPESVVGELRGIVEGLAPAPNPNPRPGTPAQPISLTLGEDDCATSFTHDVPEERFRYSMLVRLVEPRTSVVIPTIDLAPANGGVAPTHFPIALRNQTWLGMEGSVSDFVERVPIDQPISVDGFRDQIVGDVQGRISNAETVPMAASLGLGYLVHLQQAWTPAGLSLGDLLFSLPLAPGEQQKIAVFDQRQTLTVTELESLDVDEQQRQSQISDSSTRAVFDSAFQEMVRGASTYTTKADSSSWGAAGGLGLAIGPIVLGLGGGGGGGSASTNGTSTSSLDGARDYSSTAASYAHSAVEHEATARRHAQRTGIRMATASDTEEVTTKIVTNNNRVHALTMQYWEVLRHYDVSTAVDGVTLVAFVPLEVVRFLPPYSSRTLIEAEVTTRDAVLYRYSSLLKHVDVLRRWLPPQYRKGLDIIEEFAGNPRATPSFAGPAEEIVSVELHGSFLPFEDIYVAILTRRGTRIGPVRLSGSIPPLPDKLTDPTHVFATEAELMQELARRRGPDQDIVLRASLVLPQSMSPDEVVGFELSRAFRPLKYQLAPPKEDPIAQLIASGTASGIFSLFPEVFRARVSTQINGVAWSPSQLEAELGGPSIWGFTARTGNMPPETYASAYIAQGERFPMPSGGYPVSAQQVSPLMRFDQLLQVEQALQHVVRNTVTYSRAVWMSVTPEERAIMLEGYTIGVPTDGIADESQHVPLLNCVANQVLGFYGNAMIMPFIIPAVIAGTMTIPKGDQPVPFTTAQVQDALTFFHRSGFSPPVSHIALSTKGVLGEAVLGHCASAEKIDLTRFWNWADSPIPQAADVAANVLNKGSSLAAVTGPSSLAATPAMITNVNAGAAPDGTDLLKALIGARDVTALPDLTNSQNLATLVGNTLTTAESARKDALSTATQLASKGLDKAGEILKAQADGKKSADDAAAAKQKSADDAAAAKQQAAADAKKTALQAGVADLKTNGAQYLAVADSLGDQKAADGYAVQILAQKFGAGATIPIDLASTLFSTFHVPKGSDPNVLTQGSVAFLRALGLMPTA